MKNEAFCFQDNKLIKLDLAINELKDDEVLIQNQAIGINPVDYKMLDIFDNSHNGQIMGVDGAGIAIKSNSPLIKLGSNYAYHTDLTKDGSFAKYTIVKANALIPMPQNLDFTLAAALPCAALTAMQSIAKVPSCVAKKVLVYGAGSFVGKIICSILAKKGAFVSAVASIKNHGDLYKYGVVKCYDYANCNNFGDDYFAIFDTTANAKELVKLLKYNGHIVAILGRVEENPTKRFTKCPSLHEIALGAIHQHGNEDDFKELVNFGKYIFKKALNNELLLPKIIQYDFNDLALAVNDLSKGINGKKAVVVIK